MAFFGRFEGSGGKSTPRMKQWTVSDFGLSAVEWIMIWRAKGMVNKRWGVIDWLALIGKVSNDGLIGAPGSPWAATCAGTGWPSGPEWWWLRRPTLSCGSPDGGKPPAGDWLQVATGSRRGSGWPGPSRVAWPRRTATAPGKNSATEFHFGMKITLPNHLKSLEVG